MDMMNCGETKSNPGLPYLWKAAKNFWRDLGLQHPIPKQVRARNNYYTHRVAAIARAAAWGKKNPDKVAAQNRRQYMKKVWGLTPEVYDALKAAQPVCPICKTARTEARDHCHKTGACRGFLCDRCNRGLGYFDDSPERLRAAARHIEKHYGEPTK